VDELSARALFVQNASTAMNAPATKQINQLQDMAVMAVIKQAVGSNASEVFKIIFEEAPAELIAAICEQAPMRRKLMHHVRRFEHAPLKNALKDDPIDKFIHVELRVRGQDGAQDDQECTVALHDMPEYLTILFKALIISFETKETRKRTEIGLCTAAVMHRDARCRADGRDIDPLDMRDASGVFRLFLDEDKLREPIKEAIYGGHLSWTQIERICSLTGIDCPTDEDDGGDEDEEDNDKLDEIDMVEEHEDWIDETFMEELGDNLECDLHNFSEAIVSAGKKTRTKKRTRQQFFDAPRMKLIVDSVSM